MGSMSEKRPVRQKAANNQSLQHLSKTEGGEHAQDREHQLADHSLRHPRARLVDSGASYRRPGGVFSRRNSEADVPALGKLMSASLIGRLGSSASDYPPLQCRCRWRARASLRNRHQGPCMGLFLSRRFGRAPFFSSPVSLFDLKAVSSSRSALRSSRRAQELSRLAVAPTLRGILHPSQAT